MKKAPFSACAETSDRHSPLAYIAGRETELQQIHESVCKAGSIVGVIGAKGSGKSILLHAAAHNCAPEFNEQVYLLSATHGLSELLRRISEISVSGPALLVVDDLDRLAADEANVLFQRVRHTGGYSLLAATRPDAALASRFDRHLSIEALPLPLLFEKRLRATEWTGDIDAFCRFVEAHPLFFNALRSNSSEILRLAARVWPEFIPGGAEGLQSAELSTLADEPPESALSSSSASFNILLTISVFIFQQFSSAAFENRVDSQFMDLNAAFQESTVDAISRMGFNSHIVVTAAAVYESVSDTSQATLEFIAAGATVHVLKISRGWAQIAYRSETGPRVGWVNAHCLTSGVDSHAEPSPPANII